MKTISYLTPKITLPLVEPGIFILLQISKVLKNRIKRCPYLFSRTNQKSRFWGRLLVYQKHSRQYKNNPKKVCPFKGFAVNNSP